MPFASVESVMPRLAELAPGDVAEPGEAPDPAEKLKCPECGGDLVSVRSNEVRGAAVRTCLVCFGRWIDGCELCKLRKRGFFGRLFDVFRSRAPSQGGEEAAKTTLASPAEESARTEPPVGEEDQG